MTHDKLASLSFAELRDRLKARAEQLGGTGDVNISEVLRYLIALPDDKHTTESVDALLHLARNFRYESQPSRSLQAASRAASLAVGLERKPLLRAARGLEGTALGALGRFAEATVAQAEAWELARELRDKEREIWAIGSFGNLCVGMGQFQVAIRYFEKTRELAQDHSFADLEAIANSSLADCAVQLREPSLGFRALATFWKEMPGSRLGVNIPAVVHSNLARLYLLIDDVKSARAHAEEAARLARISCIERTRRVNEAVLGLIEVRSGQVETGLSVLNHALERAKEVEEEDVPDYLGMCIDAYEFAGYPDKALAYLQKLVERKKKSIDAAVVPLQCDALAAPIQFQTGVLLTDDGLVAKAYSLHTGVQDRVRLLVETSVNAEMSAGHDLYRTFRVAKLARHLATIVGWDERNTAPLALGAQLCNIGMTAVPTRILQRGGVLSVSERKILQDHAQYGSELLRKSNMQILDVASVVAEQHHERYDGSGYPRGLRGNAIAEGARIVSICEAFDAMTHQRPWRAAPMTVKAALSELEQGAESQFDPVIVKAFVAFIRNEFSRHDDFDVYLAEGADEVEYVRVRARMEALISEGH